MSERSTRIGHNSAFAEANARIREFLAEKQRLAELAPYQRLRDVMEFATVHAGRLCRSRRVEMRDGRARIEGEDGITIAVLFTVAQLSSNQDGQCHAGIRAIAARLFAGPPADAKETMRRVEAVDRALRKLEAAGCVLLRSDTGQREHRRVTMRVIAPTEIGSLSGSEPDRRPLSGSEPDTRGHLSGSEPDRQSVGLGSGRLSGSEAPHLSGSETPKRDDKREMKKEGVLPRSTSAASGTWGDLDLGDDPAPDFITLGAGGTITAALPYENRKTGKSGIVNRTLTGKDIRALAQRLLLSPSATRQVVFDTFCAWHAGRRTGFGNEWLAEFIADAEARYVATLPEAPPLTPQSYRDVGEEAWADTMELFHANDPTRH